MLQSDVSMSRPTTAAAAIALEKQTPRSMQSPKKAVGSKSLVLESSQTGEFVDEDDLSKSLGNSSAFTEFLDHSKMNRGRHNGTKQDTFGTPSRLDKRQASTVERRLPLGDANYLIEICEQGFSKSMRIIGKEILRESREELQKALETMRNETREALTNREADTAATLAHITDRVENIFQESIRPAKLDFSQADLAPLRDFLHIGDEGRWESQRQKLQRLEEKFDQNVSTLLQQVDSVLRMQEQTENDWFPKIRDEIQKIQRETDEALKNSQHQLARLLNAQEALATKAEQTIVNVSDFKTEVAQKQAELVPNLDDRITHRLKDSFVNVDLTQVVGNITRVEQTVTVEFEGMLQEISKIQRALHLDFAVIKEEIDVNRQERSKLAATMERSPFRKVTAGTGNASQGATKSDNKAPARKRFREFWVQTDIDKQFADASCQTDPSLTRKPVVRKKIAKSRSTVTVAQTTERPKQVFTDGEALKKRARAAAIRPQYNVFDYYHTTGCVQACAKSRFFEFATLAVIFANAVWIAIDTDKNKADVLIDAHPVFQIAENLFCAYFTVELTIRFLAFKGKFNCLRDGWFVFDSVLVFLMVIETWVITAIMLALDVRSSANVGDASIFRMIRLVKMFRVSRLARLLRAIPELVILMKGIGAASRSVLVFLALWFIIIYVFAVVCRQLTDGDAIGLEHFPTVPEAMNTLLLRGMLPENAGIVYDVTDAKPILWPIFIIFILLACVTLMYMLIGVLVEIVAVIATTEKEVMTVSAVATNLREAVENQGYDSETMAFEKEDFARILLSPEISRIVLDVGVDLVTLIDSTEVIFEDLEKQGSAMTFQAFVELVLNTRGSNPATVKDIKEQLRVLKTMIATGSDRVYQRLEAATQKLKTEIRELRDEAMRYGEMEGDEDEEEEGGRGDE